MKWLNGYRMRLMLIGFVAAIMLCSGSANADFTWTLKADMPTPRWLVSASAVNGKIYAIGGRTGEPDNVKFSTVEEYDPAIDTWTQKADMLTARSQLSTCAMDGKIYAIGGSRDAASAVEEYDPATDTWTRKADLPTERRALATCVVNGKIYAIGGNTPGILIGLKTVEEYDPVTDTWTRKADMLTGVWGVRACAVNGKIYAFGGRPVTRAIPNVQEYDPATDTWTRKSDMPIDTSSMGSVVLDDKIVVIGGWLSSGTMPNYKVQVYDPETDIWTLEDNAPFLRSCCGASIVRGRIYVIGGTDRVHPCPATSTVFECDTGLRPISPDFNGDGIVDAVDMCIMVDHWGENYPLCDIGTTPLGDGIVDVEDLILLAEYLFEEVDDPTLIAHWPLDETEGIFAADSVSGNDAFVIGGAVWQPGSGQINGTLQLNGIDGCAITNPVINPVYDSFSVFAWVKGGAPGQVIVSQQAKANWLATDTEGNLMTELKSSDQLSSPLFSETVLTDEQWHRVGLVWDGSHRKLFIDGVTVAEDAQPGLEGSQMGLYIGTGKAMEPGTYFSGLIDDIRIYNRAVSP